MLSNVYLLGQEAGNRLDEISTVCGRVALSAQCLNSDQAKSFLEFTILIYWLARIAANTQGMLNRSSWKGQ